MEATKVSKTASQPVRRSVSHGVGRRKAAIARVWLQRGKGSVDVNGVDYVEYFKKDITQTSAVMLPFLAYPNAADHYSVKANVKGGGSSGQADAVKLAIARAIFDVYEESRSALKAHGLLTVDSRVKERKKYGQKAARRKFQFVKR
ncbi:MAG: 30S ribosomal protein S9 [Candidatus Babeliaceae bacterium]|jgi:small subunit ribosomal protein S9